MYKPRLISDSEAQNFSASYNTLRIDCRNFGSLSLKDWQSIFQKYNLPHSHVLIGLCSSYGLLIKVGYGSYELPKEPVHFKVCRKYMEACRRQLQDYKKRSISKKAEQAPVVPTETPAQTATVVEEVKALEVEECIAFLKEKGYLILKIC